MGKIRANINLADTLTQPIERKIAALLQRDENGNWIAAYRDVILKTAFQPIFRILNGKVRPVAFEGLIRPFKDGVHIMPGTFFGSVEEKDIELIEATARTLHIRNAAKLHPKARRLFVNFDPSALASVSTFESTLDHLAVELKASNLKPTDCICEITEQGVKSEQDLSYFVYSLRARGYLIAVDDFGADSSNMKRIKALTPDIVKFDGALVKRLMATPEGLKQLKLMLGNFNALRISTVLEGIEEPWQIEMADAAGCEMLQGYAMAVPRILPNNFNEWFDAEETFIAKPLISKPAAS